MDPVTLLHEPFFWLCVFVGSVVGSVFLTLAILSFTSGPPLAPLVTDGAADGDC